MPTSYWQSSAVCQSVRRAACSLASPLKLKNPKQNIKQRLPFSNGVYSTEYVPSALSWMRQSAGEPDGLVTCVLMWSPPAFVRGRASTVNSAVASRKTSAGYALKSHLKNHAYFRQQNILWTSMINNSFGNITNRPRPRVTMGTYEALTTFNAQKTLSGIKDHKLDKLW